MALADLNAATARLVQRQCEIQGRAVALSQLLVHLGDLGSTLV
jgi:hypothetical protein